MFLHRIVPGVTLVFALAAPSAQAFFDPPWITPAAPRAGEVVSVSIRGGICDSIFFRPGYPQITRQGNAIRILEYGHHWDDTELCIYDIGTLVEPIGAFPPGDYVLTVDFIYPDVLGPTTVTLGTIAFAVVGATPASSVPTTTAWGRFALLTLVFGSALRSIHFRTRRRVARD